jgi:hypothetical protein
MTAATSFCGILLLVSAFVAAHFCHAFTAQIKRRRQALSAGVAVAYVFVNVVPELEEHRPIVAISATGTLLDTGEANLSLGASRVHHLRRTHAATSSPAERWGIYTPLIGYLLLHREDLSMLSLWLYVFAMGLHIFMPRGRVLQVFCLLAGWTMGVVDALAGGVAYAALLMLI